MTNTHSPAGPIAEAIAKLRAAGYRVVSGDSAAAVTPDWLEKFRPEFVAQREDEFLVVEVKKRPAGTASPELGQLTELASEISKRSGWGLELVWLGDDEVRAAAADVDDLIARAERVLDVDVEAALLLVWPAVETSLRVLASRVEIRDVHARQLLAELYSVGLLSERHLEELEGAYSLRNSIAHRVGSRGEVEAAVVLRLAQLARRIASPRYIPVDQMIEWFHENYMDPANGVPYNSGQGGYLYVNGGPFDAFEVLSEEFPEALQDELNEAADLLAKESLEWVRQGDY
ncbi:hypothetical protein [Cellulosimicrobium cellulans]|uniref:hypothetical protein n=1 Tax=Cellulosimicrobium cellulans TaxID=1710 RepID=UPI00301AE98C